MSKDQQSEGGPSSIGRLADNLNSLFDKIRPTQEELGPGKRAGREYHNAEIAAKINAGNPYGVTITGQYIGEIRRGVTTNPSVGHARALAWAFGVAEDAVISDRVADAVSKELGLVRRLKELDVGHIALRQVLRVHGLSDRSTALVEQLVSQLSELESLEPSEPSQDTPD
jgi:hypothetical protein